MASLVGLAAFWGALVAFFAPSLFTKEGRAFWVGLWGLLKPYLCLCWAKVKKVSKVFAKWFYCCYRFCHGCCCPDRKSGNHDLKRGEIEDSDSRAPSPEDNPAPLPDVDSTAPDTSASTRAPPTINVTPWTPSHTKINVEVRPGMSTSVSTRDLKPGGLSAQSRRSPYIKVQPLGVNLGQDFTKPGRALTQGKGKGMGKGKDGFKNKEG
jgi:hypothetical protein